MYLEGFFLLNKKDPLNNIHKNFPNLIKKKNANKRILDHELSQTKAESPKEKKQNKWKMRQ